MKSKPRDNDSDAGSILDRASAFMSVTGGGTMSVKSGFLSNLTLATAKSFNSTRSSRTNQIGNNYSNLYTNYISSTKAKRISSPRDIFEAEPIKPIRLATSVQVVEKEELAPRATLQLSNIRPGSLFPLKKLGTRFSETSTDAS